MTALDLAPYNLLKTPIFLFDSDEMRILWANQAGVKAWQATSLDELCQRDHPSMERSRLQAYQQQIHQGKTVVAQWMIGPECGSESVVHCHLSSIELEVGRTALLVEVMPEPETPRPQLPSHQPLPFRKLDGTQDKLLKYIVEDVHSSLNAQHLLQIQHSLQAIAARLGETFQVSRCHIYLYSDPTDPHLAAVAEYQASSFLSLIGLKFPVASNPCAQKLLMSNQPLAMKDVPENSQLDSLCSQVLTPALRSLLAVQTSHQQKPNGAILLSQCNAPREWTSDERQALELIAPQVGMVLAQVQRLEHTQPFLQECRILPAQKDGTAEKRLRKARAQATFQQAAVGLAESDTRTGCFTYVNHRFCDMVGYTEAELCGGMRVADITHPDDLGASLEGIEAVVSGQVRHLRLPKRYLCKDGSILKAETTVSLIHSPISNVSYCLAVIQDMTEQAQVEQALEQQVQRELLLRDITQEIRQSLDAQQIFQTTVNRIGEAFHVSRCHIHCYFAETQAFPIVGEYLETGFGSMLGVDISVEETPCVQEMLAQEQALCCPNVYTHPLLQCSIPADRELELKSLLVVRTSYQGQPNGAIVLHHCGPPLSRPAFMALPASDQEQLIRQWTSEEVALLEAVASQVGIALAHAQLLEQEKRQRQELTQKNMALAQAKKEADLANHAKSNFLANMSHELRTPLNGILGYGQILRRSTSLTPQEQKGIRVILECGEHLLNLIDDLLDLSKIEVERMELKATDIHFPDFLMELVNISQLKAKQKGINFFYHLSPALPSAVHTDEKRLRQVLMNLLDNALKFTLQGSVTFSVDCDQYAQPQRSSPSPQHHSFSQVQRLRFKVVDTGVGIPPGDLNRIFLPFEQAAEGTLRRKGTGLGLAVSQKIMMLLGGEIQVRSRLQEGSIFSVIVDLPVVPARSGLVNALKDSTGIVSYRGDPKTLLIVDDQSSNREMFGDVLGRLGFKVLKASNGQEGLEMAIESRPDLILVDLVMPVMDGLEMSRALRMVPELQNLPVIASSASVAPLDQQRSQEAGCDAFIPKPVQMDQLLHLLQHYLHLQWVEQQAPSHQIDEQPSAQDLMLPSIDRLEAFYYLAQKGSIYEILDELEPLEQADAALQPFCRYLAHLIDDLQVNQLKTFLTTALETPRN